MLEGLEISVLDYSKTFIDNSVKRFDAEYFKKEYLKEDNLRSKIKNKYLGDISFITDGQHGYHEVDESSPIRHLKAQNFKNWFAVDNNAERIAKWVDDNNKRSSLEEDDIILTTRGSVGFCAIVKDDVLPANIDQDVARIKLNNDSEIIPQYLLTYINSRFGKDWTKRNQTGMVQQGLSLWRVREFPVPILSIGLQGKIKVIIESSKGKIANSQSKYTQAETILLQEISLQNFEPSQKSVNIKNFKESFGITKRLDAEYYQIKYEQVIEKIVAQKHDSLINIVEITKSIEPGSKHYSDEEGMPFYRVSDYNKFGLSKPDKELTKSFVTFNKDQIEKLKPRKGAILFSKDGSVGTAYLLREDLDGITSGAILHLHIKNSKEIIPEYLTLALNSKLVQMQAERDAGGSIILHWRKEEIEQVIVPIIDFKKQEQIAKLIEESFKLKVESERLLKVAKTAVEMAIEVNETASMKFIKENS